MSFGMVIRREDNSVWATPDSTFMHFERKVTLTRPAMVDNKIFGKMVYQTDVPVKYSIMPFVKLKSPPENWMTLGVGRIYDNGGQWAIELIFQYDSKQPVWWQFDLYLFSSRNPKPSGNYGIVLYSKSGDIAYSADTLPLQLYTTTESPNGAYLVTAYDKGESIAVLPVPTTSIYSASAYRTVSPLAAGNSLYFSAQYYSAWAMYGYAPNSTLKPGFSGITTYIKTAMYD